MVVTGGCGWWRRRFYGLREGLERGGGVKNCVFHAEERIYNLQISLSELILLIGSPLLALSATFRS